MPSIFKRRDDISMIRIAASRNAITNCINSANGTRAIDIELNVTLNLYVEESGKFI